MHGAVYARTARARARLVMRPRPGHVGTRMQCGPAAGPGPLDVTPDLGPLDARTALRRMRRGEAVYYAVRYASGTAHFETSDETGCCLAVCSKAWL